MTDNLEHVAEESTESPESKRSFDQHCLDNFDPEVAKKHMRLYERATDAFEKEYHYWRVAGLTHFEAKNAAIDYYRKHTRREIIETEEMPLDVHEGEAAFDASDLADFNKVFSKVMVFAPDPKLKLLFCLIIRLESLEDNLNEFNKDVCQRIAGDKYPESQSELSRMMGYKAEGNRVASSVTALKYRLQEFMESLDIVDKYGSKFSFVR